MREKDLHPIFAAIVNACRTTDESFAAAYRRLCAEGRRDFQPARRRALRREARRVSLALTEQWAREGRDPLTGRKT